MISFRDVTRRETTADKLDQLDACLARGDAEPAFFEAGELEQSVLDALHAGCDGWGETERQLRALSRAAAAAYRASRAGLAADESLCRARGALARLHRATLPPVIEVRAPEGYAHYALDPLGYAHAAERYAAEVGSERAARAVVVGVRSVGTSLSGIVAAELGTRCSVTVRPRGASGARRVEATPELCEVLLAGCADGGDVLIVDEGPGATGETFRCVAGWLAGLGVPAARIVLFASHRQPPAFGDPAVSAFLASARRYAPPESDDRIERVCARFGLSAPEDLSGGRWRELVPGAGGSVAFPRHERLKYRARDRAGRPRLIRYAGLGRSGAEAALRAARLASAGIGPEVVGCEAGFLATDWIEGRPLSPACPASPSFAGALATYLATRAPLFRTGSPADTALIVEMLRENASEMVGGPPAGRRAVLRRIEQLPQREAVIPDARLQAREWIRTPGSAFHKVDAIDHGDGVRLPGPTDPAWDLAGAAVEYRLDAAALRALVQRCSGGAAGNARELAQAVAAYRAPYAACQLGEAALTAREDGSEADQAWLRREAARYEQLLRRELALAATNDG